MSTPIEAAHSALARDAAHADSAIWITRVPDATVLARAAVLEAEGPRGRPLWGVPFAVKDNIDVAGMPTTAGCPGYAFTPTASAPAVQALLDAGALLLGKTNLDQFATGLVGTRSPYGVPRNVFDPARVPGGSSSGSAVAVAAGIVPFSLGTDTAGSGRVPAMFGNIVGLKPSLGSLSTRGVVPACRSIDTISVFAGDVDQALAVARVMAGYDDLDRYRRRAPWPHLRRAGLPAAPRIAAIDASGLCEAPVAATYARAAAQLGAVQIDIAPFLAAARLLYDGPWVAERSAALHAQIVQRPDILHPVTRVILESGLGRSATDAFNAFHLVAATRRLAARLFAQFDALLLPTAPFTPSLAEVAADPIKPNSRLGTFTNFVNICDLAGWAVPIGFGADGLPVGATLLGPAWSDGRLAPIADALHRAFADHVGATDAPLPPSLAADGIGPDETALFCVGAHMSGLALNGQITERGGRFLRVASTTPEYWLYALGPRPAMLRATPEVGVPGMGTLGSAIPGEVWALPTAAIGSLLAEVPPPLGFGTVALDDGPCLGFLAEAAGLAGARDITGFGGWRGWLAAGAI